MKKKYTYFIVYMSSDGSEECNCNVDINCKIKDLDIVRKIEEEISNKFHNGVNVVLLSWRRYE